MKLFTVFLILLNTISVTFSQIIFVDSIAELPNTIIESSGLIFYNNKLITHTDSDGESALYEIDTNTAQITRTTYIKNTTNVDWEDICQDDDFIYIGDFGNNNGSRTDLKILKISKQEYNTTTNDSIDASFIYFNYEDQVNFNPPNFSTNFDAEALIAFEDSLYIFTKNWGDKKTKVYSLSKDTGTIIAKKVMEYNVEGLITGADYNTNNNKIMLCGYALFGEPFIVELKDFSSNQFFNGTVSKVSLKAKQSQQVESICNTKDNKYFLSSEKFITLKAVLHSLETPLIRDNETIKRKNIKVFPNPTNNTICVNVVVKEMSLYDFNSKILRTSGTNCIELKNLNNKMYILKVILEDNSLVTLKVNKI